MPFDPVRSRKTLLDQEEAPVGGLTQVGNLKRCPAEVLWVTAGAKGIGMRAECLEGVPTLSAAHSSGFHRRKWTWDRRTEGKEPTGIAAGSSWSRAERDVSYFLVGLPLAGCSSSSSL